MAAAVPELPAHRDATGKTADIGVLEGEEVVPNFKGGYPDFSEAFPDEGP